SGEECVPPPLRRLLPSDSRSAVATPGPLALPVLLAADRSRRRRGPARQRALAPALAPGHGGSRDGSDRPALAGRGGLVLRPGGSPAPQASLVVRRSGLLPGVGTRRPLRRAAGERAVLQPQFPARAWGRPTLQHPYTVRRVRAGGLRGHRPPSGRMHPLAHR